MAGKKETVVNESFNSGSITIALFLSILSLSAAWIAVAYISQPCSAKITWELGADGYLKGNLFGENKVMDLDLNAWVDSGITIQKVGGSIEISGSCAIMSKYLKENHVEIPGGKIK